MRTLLLTSATMVAFAANSLLCRAALAVPSRIDAVSFTAIRIASGALALGLIVAFRGRAAGRAAHKDHRRPRGRAALTAGAMLVYALPFSLAYLALDAGTGALILFGAVQLTMIGGGMLSGERPSARHWIGLCLALGGLVYLVSPGVTAPDPGGAILMAVAGVAWGVYSLLGRGVTEPLRATRDNFLLAAPVALVAAVIAAAFVVTPSIQIEGLILAAISGALASGVGYALWYAAMRGLKATTAAMVQLSVPVIAAVGGVLLLSETLTERLAVASIVTLGGIGLAVARRSPKRSAVDTTGPADATDATAPASQPE